MIELNILYTGPWLLSDFSIRQWLITTQWL